MGQGPIVKRLTEAPGPFPVDAPVRIPPPQLDFTTNDLRTHGLRDAGYVFLGPFLK